MPSSFGERGKSWTEKLSNCDLDRDESPSPDYRFRLTRRHLYTNRNSVGIISSRSLFPHQ